MTPDSVDIDHRRVTTRAGMIAAYLPADMGPHAGPQRLLEAVHRLSDLGAVVTHAARGTSQEGFDAEWRDRHGHGRRRPISRFEVFDEADLDAALARFDELHPQVRRLKNAATQADDALLCDSRPATGRRSERSSPTRVSSTIAVPW